MSTDVSLAVAKRNGRPEVPVDLKVLMALASVGCTNKEIAAHFGVSERTIETRRRDPVFRQTMDRGEALGNISLRRTQMSLALKGDRTMLVWLGKQRLGQKDRIDHSGAVETAPPKIHVNFVSPDPKGRVEPNSSTGRIGQASLEAAGDQEEDKHRSTGGL